jgi:hypothetical protein
VGPLADPSEQNVAAGDSVYTHYCVGASTPHKAVGLHGVLCAVCAVTVSRVATSPGEACGEALRHHSGICWRD